ncbi:cytochrome P450 [Lophiotrema nucula]|uniref:Cytochrome P450 n=1 Tax=Lophiotrema nucula TaxID=690887 RepID=A0A6A5YHC7_9PLEO|nr:cytochrome P450 [Lophiotrema nucula]
MPEAVVKSAYARDNSGIAPKPLPGTNVPPEKRFFHLHHRLVLKEMSGRSLNQMTSRFLESQERRFANSEIGEDWTNIPDLYSWLENVVFQASVESLAGTKIFDVIPNLMNEYRDFYNAAPTILRGLPRVFSPKAYKARDTLVASLRKWHEEAQKNNPLRGFDTEGQGWDEWWGTQFVKQRKALVLAMDGMTLDGMASDDLALILTANVNAVPSAAWLIIDVMRNPSLFERVMPEVTGAFEADAEGRKSLNIVKLCNSPLLQSIYAETLRLRTSNMLPRVINTGEQPLKRWTFPKKGAVFVLGNVAAFDENVWNSGTGSEPHPLHEFWADRFLKYPDDPRSGPLRNPAPEAKKAGLDEITEDDGPRFTTSGLDGAWIPYGGGINMCPGRHFAKQELIGTFAMLVSQFDMEILTPPEVKIEPNTGFRIFGTMPPKGKIEARIRRRRAPMDR